MEVPLLDVAATRFFWPWHSDAPFGLRATWHMADVISVHRFGGLVVVRFRCAPVWTTQFLQLPKAPARGASAATKAAYKVAKGDVVWGDGAIHAPDGVDAACAEWAIEGATATSLNKPIRAMELATDVRVVSGPPHAGAALRFDQLPEDEQGSKVSPHLGIPHGVAPADSHLQMAVNLAGQRCTRIVPST